MELFFFTNVSDRFPTWYNIFCNYFYLMEKRSFTTLRKFSQRSSRCVLFHGNVVFPPAIESEFLFLFIYFSADKAKNSLFGCWANENLHFAWKSNERRLAATLKKLCSYKLSKKVRQVNFFQLSFINRFFFALVAANDKTFLFWNYSVT